MGAQGGGRAQGGGAPRIGGGGAREDAAGRDGAGRHAARRRGAGRAAATGRLAERRGGIAAAASAEDAFAAFLIAADTTSVLESFRTLLGATGIPANAGRGMLEALRQRLLPSLKWRQAQLINKLHERRTSGEYAAAAEAVRHGRPVLRALVMGGGPIGLRCAVELALLGHSVLALEQRTAFTRLNVLHLWDWVSHDLAELGIKSLDPSVFASCDYAHVGTSQLQHSLLKIALLLGVQVRLGAKVRDLADLRASEPAKRRSLDWPTHIQRSPGGTPCPVPLLPAPQPTGAAAGGGRRITLRISLRSLPPRRVASVPCRRGCRSTPSAGRASAPQGAEEGAAPGRAHRRRRRRRRRVSSARTC